MASYDIFETFDSKRAITYRGSKRRYLSRIFLQILRHCRDVSSVLDLFSGSGVVAAYLRSKGLVVDANDLASYSYYTNKVNLEFTYQNIWDRYPNLNKLFRQINKLSEPKAKNLFFAKFYSPNEHAQRQRLFFTRRNGLFIDAVLEYIWENDDEILRALVLHDLLIKMSRHANTNGVFNACFKQFGGPQRQDLSRITRDICLDIPYLSDQPTGNSFQKDAIALLSERPQVYDAIYIDPPYNNHQYLSNYHILEAACKPMSERYSPIAKDVSGIDPQLPKSKFSRKTQVEDAFQQLFAIVSCRCRYAILSYNSNGHMPLTKIKQTIESFGQIAEIEQFDVRPAIGAGSRVSKDKTQEYLIAIDFTRSLSKNRLDPQAE